MTQLVDDQGKIKFEGLRFMVVDDQPFVRHIVREAVLSVGVNDVVQAENGGEALKIMAGYSVANEKLNDISTAPGTYSQKLGAFDCIFADFNMRPVNGLNLLAAIRTGKARIPRATPVIVLTGHSDDHLVSASIALDASGFIVKPASRNTLLERARRAMTRPINLRSSQEYALVTIPGAAKGEYFAAERSAQPAEPKKLQVKDILNATQVTLGQLKEGQVWPATSSAPPGRCWYMMGRN